MNRGTPTAAVWAALLVVVGCPPAMPSDTPCLSATVQGKVIAVADGDTLTILGDRTQHRIRLHGIDAPEKGQPFRSKSGQALAEMLFGLA